IGLVVEQAEDVHQPGVDLQHARHPGAFVRQEAAVLLVALPVAQVDLLVGDVDVGHQDEFALGAQLQQVGLHGLQEAVFAPYLDVNGLMFRIINTRSNQLINLEVSVSMSRVEPKPDGTLFRKYYALGLERNKVSFFPANWTVVHPITEQSPLFGCTPDELEQSDAEFLVTVQALDDTFIQNVYTRFSYRYNEVKWGQKFRPMFDGSQPMPIKLDLDKLDETEAAPLN
ncbi:MAG: hypothetical protein EOO39_40920, partial [Cytophagaceae bacterium]